MYKYLRREADYMKASFDGQKFVIKFHSFLGTCSTMTEVTINNQIMLTGMYVYNNTLTGVAALAVTGICREHSGMSVQPTDSRRRENSSLFF